MAGSIQIQKWRLCTVFFLVIALFFPLAAKALAVEAPPLESHHIDWGEGAGSYCLQANDIVLQEEEVYGLTEQQLLEKIVRVSKATVNKRLSGDQYIEYSPGFSAIKSGSLGQENLNGVDRLYEVVLLVEPPEDEWATDEKGELIGPPYTVVLSVFVRASTQPIDTPQPTVTPGPSNTPEPTTAPKPTETPGQSPVPEPQPTEAPAPPPIKPADTPIPSPPITATPQPPKETTTPEIFLPITPSSTEPPPPTMPPPAEPPEGVTQEPANGENPGGTVDIITALAMAKKVFVAAGTITAVGLAFSLYSDYKLIRWYNDKKRKRKNIAQKGK